MERTIAVIAFLTLAFLLSLAATMTASFGILAAVLISGFVSSSVLPKSASKDVIASGNEICKRCLKNFRRQRRVNFGDHRGDFDGFGVQ